MNILDENIPAEQYRLLKAWGIPVRQIGREVGRKGLQDSDVIPCLLGLAHPTLFTLDIDFWRTDLRHPRYCLVFLDVGRHEAAVFIRRFLRQSQFDTQAKRMGTVIRVSHAGLSIWRIHAEQKAHYSWGDADGRMLSSAIREDEGLYVVEYSEHDADLGPDQR